MLGVAFATQSPITGVRHLRRRAAARAEAVPLMPIDQGLRLRDDCGVSDRDHLCRRTCLTEIAESGERSHVRRVPGFRDVKRKYRPVAIETQEDARCFGTRERIRNSWPQQAKRYWRARPCWFKEKRLQAPHREYK